MIVSNKQSYDRISSIYYIVTFVSVIVLGVIVNMLLSRKINWIDMIESLKKSGEYFFLYFFFSFRLNNYVIYYNLNL